MDENQQKVVVQQTNPQDGEKFVVVSIPQESVENIQLESQLDSENVSLENPGTASTESVAVEAVDLGNPLHQETLSLKSADAPTEPVALEASSNATSSGMSLGTPLLQWTPQQTMYTSAEAIQQDIQVLLGKLREYGQESLLITADKETIRMDGSSGGKKFIENHESVARSFHEKCFGNELDDENEAGTENNDNEEPFLETAAQEDGVEESVGLTPKRKRGRPPKQKPPDEQKPDSSKELDNEPEEKTETPVTGKKRGRPRKYPITVTKPTDSVHLDKQELEETEFKENPEKPPYTGKKRGRPRKQPVVYDQDKEDTDSGSGGIRRSNRPVKRKVIESLGFTPPKAKRKSGVGYSDLKIKRMIQPEYINVENTITMENDQSQSTENDDIGTISEISGSDKSQPNELVCSHCGFSAEDQEVMENHIRVEHPKVWAQILIDDTKILLALGKDPHKVQRSRPGAQVPKKEAPKEQKPKAVIRYITSAQGGKKKRRSDGPRSSGHYSCTVCQKRYKTICLLNAHMGLVHKDRRYAQIKRRKELLKYKQRLIALKKKNDQNKDGEDDTEERKKDEEVEEIKKEAEDVEEEETVSEMKAEAGEEVEKTRRSRRSTRRKSRKLDDYETDLPELYRSDDEDIDMNAHYDDPYACPLCLKECHSENGLSEHLKRTKHGEVTVTPYPCLTCNRFFVDFKTLELHMTQSGHMGEEMGSLDGEITVTKQKSVSKRGILLYVCSLCKREFVKEENCQSHCALKVCKKPWKKSCPIISCKKLFFENNMFFQHMYSEHKSEYPFVCSVEGCKWLFFHTAALNSHVSAHSAEKDGHFPPPRPIEDGRKRCGYCGMLFTYNENLRQHVKKIHDNEIFGKFKEMVEHNKAAEPLSTNKKFLQVQKDKEEDVDKIDTFKRMDKTQVTIRNHVSGEEFKCYTCDETFSHIDDVGDHMVDTGHCGLPLNALNGARDIRIRIRNTGEQCYVCTLCKMEFKKKETIDKHVQDATCKKKYKRLCPIMSCRILFRNFNYFKAHMSTMHKDEFPFKCQECGKEFEQTTALNSHRNSHYKDTQHIQTDVLNSDTPMTCHICKERFRNNRELREHKEKAHEIQRKYMCDICGKKYKRKENLKDHIFMAHERDPSKDFVSCPTCGKALSSRRSLRFHLRFAHTDAKPCVCEICGYSTKQLGNLAFHMRNTHSDVRPYECEWPGCTKTFKDRQLWQRHTQRHEIAAGNLEKAKTYGPIFTCKICQKGFCGKYNLDKHMVCHVNEFPLSCNLCGKGVKRIGSLRRHLRTVHHFDPKTNTHMEPVTTIRKPKSLMKKEPVRINLDLTSASQEEQESIEADFKELEYQLHTDAQQKYHQILNASIEVPSTSASGSASEQKGRDYMSEAQSQVSLLEGGASIAENVIEEAVDESQIIIENVGDQYIIMNPDGNISNLEQLGRDIILAVKNDDGVVCLQMVGK